MGGTAGGSGEKTNGERSGTALWVRVAMPNANDGARNPSWLAWRSKAKKMVAAKTLLVFHFFLEI